MNKINWIVNLVGNPCNHLAKARHLLSLNQLGLRLLQFLQGLFQLLGLLSLLGFRLLQGNGFLLQLICHAIKCRSNLGQFIRPLQLGPIAQIPFGPTIAD